MNTSILTINKFELNLLYSNCGITEKERVLDKLGALKPIFKQFIENEQNISPHDLTKLINLFESCSDPSKSENEILEALLQLEPGNGRIGFRQVNLMVDYLRKKITSFVEEKGYRLDLISHDHAFGSGGDLLKTMHATTAACILAAPLVTICKTGTRNVTSAHGSNQAIMEFGYNQFQVNYDFLNNLLLKNHFAYIPLDYLGFPYSESLKQARKRLWEKTVAEINANYNRGEKRWQDIVRNINLPINIDIFKIVSPNAQVLNPVHHSTGVCHLKMLPYVIGIYLHLNSQGIIAHCYDGIDEISNAYFDPYISSPNNLIIKIDSENVTIAEFCPEDIGLTRVHYEAIKEQELRKEKDIFIHILLGKKGVLQPKRDFLVANAALLLVASNKNNNSKSNLISSMGESVKKIEYLIDSGESYDNFRQLIDQINFQFKSKIPKLVNR